MSSFDEKSGIVTSKTTWGEWWQTVEETCVIINVPENLNKKDVQFNLKNKSIKLVIKDFVAIEVVSNFSRCMGSPKELDVVTLGSSVLPRCLLVRKILNTPFLVLFLIGVDWL